MIYMLSAVASVLVGVLVIVVAAPDPTTDSNAATTPDSVTGSDAPSTTPTEPASSACEAIPESKREPARRRACEKIVMRDTAIDLDSMDRAWGAPEVTLSTGADLMDSSYPLRKLGSGGLSDSPRRLSYVDAAPSYDTCRSSTVWNSETDVAAGDIYCIRTDGGRLGLLFVDAVPTGDDSEKPVTIYVTVWEKEAAPTPSTPSPPP